jgi:hypothetical protein
MTVRGYGGDGDVNCGVEMWTMCGDVGLCLVAHRQFLLGVLGGELSAGECRASRLAWRPTSYLRGRVYIFPCTGLSRLAW